MLQQPPSHRYSALADQARKLLLLIHMLAVQTQDLRRGLISLVGGMCQVYFAVVEACATTGIV